MLADRDWKLAQVHRHITEQLKTKGKDTLEQLNQNFKKPDFIEEFLGPILKEIVVKEESGDTKIIDTTNSRQKSLEEFCKKYKQMY